MGKAHQEKRDQTFGMSGCMNKEKNETPDSQKIEGFGLLAGGFVNEVPLACPGCSFRLAYLPVSPSRPVRYSEAFLPSSLGDGESCLP